MASVPRRDAPFDVGKVARFSPAKVERLLQDAGIVRQRAKIEATIANARAILLLEAGGVRFVDYVWSFVGGRPKENFFSEGSMPAQTDESRAMSKDLKRRGFAFVGPTTCYSFMQSAGLVNDHVANCFRHAECAALA